MRTLKLINPKLKTLWNYGKRGDKKRRGEVSENNDFMLNPDSLHVDMVIAGVLENEKKYELKFCPCRLTGGIREKDLELLCPCNFR